MVENRDKVEIDIIEIRLEKLRKQLKEKEEDAEKSKSIHQQVIGQFFLIQSMISEEEDRLEILKNEKQGIEK